MRILISAYACEPGSGSEGGYGWNYPSELARRGNQVHTVVPERWREGVEREIARAPHDRLTFHFVAEREWPLRLGWTLGSALRYFLWQWDAAQAALRLDALHDFEVVHHVSYGTLLGGSFMWRLGKPFVFGPTGGGQVAPSAFLTYFGTFSRSEAVRTMVTKHLWRLDWPAIRAARSARVVLASNRETALLAGRMGAQRVESMLDVYLPDHIVPSTPTARAPRESVRLLWVGRLLARKGQQLTVEALDLVPGTVAVELDIVGDGPVEADFRGWLGDTRRVHPVKLRGRIPWSDVHRAYDDADVFIFTSLRDTVGIQLLEAMAHALPVITLDHQGAAELVPDDAGIKVPVTSPSETRRGVADAILRLAASPELRATLGDAAHRRALEFTLSKRISDVEALYVEVASIGAAAAHASDEPAYVELNERQTESESDDFTPRRYVQFARHLRGDGSSVLDVGCGVGRGGRVLKRMIPGITLMGLDCVPGRIERIPPGVYARAFCATSMAMPLEGASVDCIVAGEFIEHLSEADVDRTLQEFARVLRPGGKLLMTTPNPSYWRLRLTGRSVLGGAHLSEHQASKLAARLRRHGFSGATVCGSGRWSKYLGERFPLPAAYGSYLITAHTG